MAAITDLKQKYDAERDKRVRRDNVDQFVDFWAPELKDLDKDPFIDYDALEAKGLPPQVQSGEDLTLLVIGAAHTGIYSAARAIEAGIPKEKILCVDNAGGFGGTWYWNRYPGVMCDVEGYCYLPLLDETMYRPKHKYSYGAEIRGQDERAAAHYGITALFSTIVKKQVWDEASARWIVSVVRERGPGRESQEITLRAQFVMHAAGPFSKPHIPKLPGFDKFRANNQILHSARWDWNLTGGTQERPEMVKLQDKRVAIIGTGATAVQIIPELAKWVKHLYVIQRTPTYIGPRNQTETTDEMWAKVVASGKGWQRKRMDHFDSFISNVPDRVDQINDGWTQTQSFAGYSGGGGKIIRPQDVEKHMETFFELDVPRAEQMRKYIDSKVHDKSVAEKLKPWYGGWCKRPAFHDHYLDTFNRDNVTLVDTDGKGIDAYSENGLVVNGEEYNVDLIVFATGFTVTGTKGGCPTQQTGAPVIGRDGRSLEEKWLGSDYATLFGSATNEFPNYFFQGPMGNGATPNICSSSDLTARIVAHTIARARQEAQVADKAVIEATRNAELWWTDEIKRRALWFSLLPTCTPGFFNGESKGFFDKKTPEQIDAELRRMPWGTGPLDYKARMCSWMDLGSLDGFTVRN
ncbi:hypothetical protein KVR01_013653 [Diaporthe batatas]|uniref:uncharacterized protein n=1 Tax=Diaporthe batatas TaxID=748121 RepID=UPI001D0422E3|nr:uncharacterized protein KVR01_013653 [Diaporthe batatas]KAG8156549.1 hypothetical protein KVR01_013653 [Diaporthe batatas]